MISVRTLFLTSPFVAAKNLLDIDTARPEEIVPLDIEKES
jgi:hypothetical protein